MTHVSRVDHHKDAYADSDLVAKHVYTIVWNNRLHTGV